MNKYDLFISHASEDKKDFVRPLAEKLKEKGLIVWYDEFSLSLGDSLSESIDKGLNSSDFAIVVLSHNFFVKNWPKRELRGLVARETIEGVKLILPIWLNLTSSEMLNFSPTLSDLKAINADIGFEEIVNELLKIFARPKWFSTCNADNDADSIMLSILAHCFIGLQDLHRISLLFPGIEKSGQITDFYNALIVEIEKYKNHSNLTGIFKIYKKPSLMDDESPHLISFLIVLIISQCFGGEKVFEKNNDLVFKSRINGLSLFLPKNIQELVQKIIEFKLFYCHVPKIINTNDTTSYSRNIEIVSKYWDILREIVVIQSQAPLGFTPHPLTRYIVSLRERIIGNLAFSNNTNVSINTFINNVDIFTNCLLSGNVDDFGLDEEWTNGIITENYTLLEKLRIQYGIGLFDLTEPEDVFIQVINQSVQTWKNMVDDKFNQLLNRAKKNYKNNINPAK